MTDKQTPDEIWAEPYDQMYWFESEEDVEGCYAKGSTSYTRTDIVQALREENQRLKAAVKSMAYDLETIKNYNTDTEQTKRTADDSLKQHAQAIKEAGE